jgi:hypothetical protein
MDATTNLYLYPRKPMNLNTLLCTTDGAGSQRSGGPSIPMKIAIPECHSFSHAQTNPNKGHRRIFGNHQGQAGLLHASAFTPRLPFARAAAFAFPKRSFRPVVFRDYRADMPFAGPKFR